MRTHLIKREAFVSYVMIWAISDYYLFSLGVSSGGSRDACTSGPTGRQGWGPTCLFITIFLIITMFYYCYGLYLDAHLKPHAFRSRAFLKWLDLGCVNVD